MLYFCHFIKDDYQYGAPSPSTDLEQVKTWMQDQFSLLISIVNKNTEVVKKNTEAVNNLKSMLQKKKDRKVNQVHVLFIRTKRSIIQLTIGGEW